ncbi:TetR/AcrR family transcriptional regulator [Archangium primigenium]|uniref:TetR/AcrR family transcriptional regulator n=1 Tax=[Archangium] primigenium TaxID=2792470 RepID=UPI001956BA59|nr:TetR/AcrR family transcriptional regulator [Archangium primigenium]MBM7119379.1 TetR/AcrR family transcriptional regulator [Archangium primigenium]
MARPADPHARASLLSAARAEFMKKGLKGARIEDITAACGLSKGAFYLHFESKEALFGEVLGVFSAELQTIIEQRRGETECFFLEHGPVEIHDVAEGSERYEQLLRVSTEGDLRTLELMWSYRDVMHVLIRGSQGTEFESVMWSYVDREVEHVSQEFQRLQSRGALRTDVPSEVIGSLIVGTYVLLAQRMCQTEEKPDLAAWARSIHRLIREGCVPRDASSRPAVAPRAAEATPSRRAPARALSRTRSTPRSGP